MKVFTHKKTLITGSLTLVLAVAIAIGSFGARASAACTAPSTDYGNVSRTLSVPGAATYRIWSRIMVPDTTNKTYLLELDGGTCFNVGGGSIPASSWTWIDYQSGSTSNKVQASWAQGNHTLKLIGNAPGVKVDRVIAVSDLACVPTGLGDNCNVPSDATPPSVTLTAPAEGATVTGSVSLTANATDNVGVTKVEFYDNSSLLATDSSSPYSATFNSASVPNGSHLIIARAYDAAGNVSTDSSTVTVKNGDSQAPSQPNNLKATAASYNTVNLTWSASTDNTGVTGYTIYRDTVPVDTVGAVTSYSNKSLQPSTTYSFQVQAFDAAGNKSTLSSKVTVTTPAPTTPDTQAPTKPTNLVGSAVSQTQINLTWTASTDNIGVSGYDVYRANVSDSAQKIGSSATTSFGDPDLSADTSYVYYVVAKDAAGNSSEASASITVKTMAPPPPSVVLSSIAGRITDSANDKPIAYSKVLVIIDGHRHTYRADRFGRYAINNIQTGRYNLNFAAKGYASKTLSVELGEQPMVQNIALNKK